MGNKVTQDVFIEKLFPLFIVRYFLLRSSHLVYFSSDYRTQFCMTFLKAFSWNSNKSEEKTMRQSRSLAVSNSIFVRHKFVQSKHILKTNVVRLDICEAVYFVEKSNGWRQNDPTFIHNSSAVRWQKCSLVNVWMPRVQRFYLLVFNIYVCHNYVPLP